MSNTIHRGGTDTERLYLHDLDWTRPTGEKVVVTKSQISDDPDNVERLEDMIARHKGRYALVGLFCRPGHRVLDFPCGSGYAAEFLKMFGAAYDGLEADAVTVEYARRVYGAAGVTFDRGDLTRPSLERSAYNVIACIEGLEHIEAQHQSPLIAAFEKALAQGGVLIVSCPEAPGSKSGPSLTNPDHLWELTRGDFVNLLTSHFDQHSVEIVTHQAVLDPGGLMTCLYGICHKK